VCDKCTLELTREELTATVFRTNDESVKIAGFKVKVPGNPVKIFKGDQLGPMSKYIYNSPHKGDHITFFDIMTNQGRLNTHVVIKLIK